MPVPVDPWTAFLTWLQSIIIPDWGGLIALLPIMLVFGVVAPALTLLAAYWVYVLTTNRRGKVHVADPLPLPAPELADGSYDFPPNAPYCPTHALIYPATTRDCPIDGEELQVRCPVDNSIRGASQQTCRTCGTRYQLGAALAPIVVTRRGSPPAGGAAIA